jgi:catechol 1,2-dioxygenase
MRGFRPAHIHIKVSYPGFETLTTQLYFEGDPYLWPNDACGPGCRSNDPKRIIDLHPEGEGKVLKGDFTMYLKPATPEQ